jgi:hypothetical protein
MLGDVFWRFSVRKAVTACLGIGFGLSLTGCPDRTVSQVQNQQGRVESKSFPINLNREVDILFVIDDSGSMADKQANLRANFPNFINVLNTIQGGLPDVHIGVVTSDVGTKGEDVANPGPQAGQGVGLCAGLGKGGNLQTFGATLTANADSPNANFIADIKNEDGSRRRNYAGDLADVFSQMANAGANGCGFEQHLHAMKRALDNNPMNAGFLRENAFLAVIFLADEDDCSLRTPDLLGADGGPLGPLVSFRCTRFGITCDDNGASANEMAQVGVKGRCHPDDDSPHLQTVSKYVNFLKGLKANDPTKVIVAGIIGPTAPFNVELRNINMQQQVALGHSCQFNGRNGTEVADPGIRLQFFLDQFPNRTTSTTICQSDLSGGMQLIGELLKESIGNPCITGDISDSDTDAPGLQPECSVSYITNFGKANAQETILPECDADATNQPCWHLLKDEALCPCSPDDVDCNPADDNENLILKIEDPVAQPDGTQITAGCVTEVD